MTALFCLLTGSIASLGCRFKTLLAHNWLNLQAPMQSALRQHAVRHKGSSEPITVQLGLIAPKAKGQIADLIGSLEAG